MNSDCAESFEDVCPDIIASKVSLLVEQASLIESELLLLVICVGRIAGQYATPRSNPFETLADGRSVHAFRGHNVNSVELDQRNPDPERLLLGYLDSRATLLMIDTTEIISPVVHSPTRNALDDTNKLVKTIFSSHEALLLPYESSLTRGRYCTSATFLWAGERTRQLDGAHIEFMRGLRNPIGVKVGPTTTPSEVVALLDRLYLNKSDSARCVTLITRLGAQNVESTLPKLICAVQASGHHQPIWMSDPCHGNTVVVKAERIKTRCVMTMLDELQRTYVIHWRLGSHLGGLHLEQMGENVVECVDYVAAGTGDLSLGVSYRMLCDPRLSREQAKLLVERFVEYVKQYEADEKMLNEQQQQQKEHMISCRIDGAAGARGRTGRSCKIIWRS